MLQSFGTFSGFWFSEIEIESFEKDKKNIWNKKRKNRETGNKNLQI